MFYPTCCDLHQDLHRERLTLAQPLNYWGRPRVSAKVYGIIIGSVIGFALLLWLVAVLLRKFIGRAGGVNRDRAERTRTDEESAITPLATLSSTMATAPPPYENPPSFEDAVKRQEMASASQPGEGHDRRDGAAG